MWPIPAFRFSGNRQNKSFGDRGSEVAEHITRQEACKRLTRAAIASFVRGDEPLIVHLAVQAAFRVCRDVVRQRDPSEDWLGNMIRPEMLKEFWKHYARIANFLKHAERDPAETVDIRNIHALNEHNIFFVCAYYWDAFPGSIDAIMWAFAGWYRSKHPEMRTDDPHASVGPFALHTEKEAWGMLQTACSLDAVERAHLAAQTPSFDW